MTKNSLATMHRTSNGFRLLSRQLNPKHRLRSSLTSSISSSYPRYQQQTTNNGQETNKTTDFGFETVAESLKASKGGPLPLKAWPSLTYASSWGSFLLSCLLI